MKRRKRLCPPQCKPAKPLDPDWVDQFIDQAKGSSDEEMQDLWARILAGEVANPGTFSRQTVATVKLLDKSDAEAFSRVCRFSFDTPSLSGPVVHLDDDFFQMKSGVTYSALEDLRAIGLINMAAFPTYYLKFPVEYGKSNRLTFRYGERVEAFELPGLSQESTDYTLTLGHVILTKTGRQLARIVIRGAYDPEIGNYLFDTMRRLNPLMRIERTSQEAAT